MEELGQKDNENRVTKKKIKEDKKKITREGPQKMPIVKFLY